MPTSPITYMIVECIAGLLAEPPIGGWLAGQLHGSLAIGRLHVVRTTFTGVVLLAPVTQILRGR